MRFQITLAAASAILVSLASPALARPNSSYNLARRADDISNGTKADTAYIANATNATILFDGANSTDGYEAYGGYEDDEDCDEDDNDDATSPTAVNVTSSATSPSPSQAIGNGEENEDCEEYEDEETADAADQTSEDAEECDDEEEEVASASTPITPSAIPSSAPSTVVSDKNLAGVAPVANAAPSPSAFYSASNVATGTGDAADGPADGAAEQDCGQVSHRPSLPADVRLLLSMPL